MVETIALLVRSRQEQETFRLLNLLRQSPEDFSLLLTKSGTTVPGVRGHLSSPISGVSKQTKTVQEIVKGLKPVTRLHMSTGLSCAARDVACYLRTFGFIASLSKPESSSTDFDAPKTAVSAPFLGKYGRVQKGGVMENFAYRFGSALDALVQILASSTEDIHGLKSQLWSPDAHVVGLAAARHSAEHTCLVLVFCSSFFDHPEDIEFPLEFDQTKTDSEFFPARIAKGVMKSVLVYR